MMYYFPGSEIEQFEYKLRESVREMEGATE